MGTSPLRISGRHLHRRSGMPALSLETLEPRQLLAAVFEPFQSISSVESGLAIIARDFDQDGFVDLAIAHNDRNMITVLFGDAGATFQRRTALFTTGRPVALVTEDFNQDKFLDIAAITEDGVINVFLADGAGRFRRSTIATDIDIGPPGTYRSLATVDLGPDGDWDLFGMSDLGFGVRTNEGEGRFDGVPLFNPVNPPLIEADYQITFAELGLNLTGRDMAVVLEEKINEVSIIIAAQDTERSTRGVVTIFREAFPDPINNPIGDDFVQDFLLTSFVDLPWSPAAIAQGDVTGDGNFDIVVVAETEPAFALLRSDRGVFTFTEYSLGQFNGGNNIILADLSGNGFRDVIIGVDGGIVVFENLGFGRFAPPAFQILNIDVDGVVAVDFDGDGRLDLVATSRTDDILIFQKIRFVDSQVAANVTPGATLSSSIRFGVNPQLTYRNTAGDPIAIFGNQFTGFRGADIRNETVGGAISGNVKSFVDPKDGLAYAVAPAPEGLILYRDNNNFFTQRNLSDETRVNIVYNDVIPVVGTDGIVRLFAIATNGDIVVFQQNGARNDLGEFFWTVRNISTSDLTNSDFGTPSFVGPIVSYVTPWNSIHIAGLDSDGRIFTVWTSGALNGEFTSNDLTEVSDAPALTGNLAVFVQPWGAINLVGLDGNGDLSITWWMPGFGGQWRNDNLSDILGDESPQLLGSTLTAFVTPWRGQNIVGLNGAGEVVTVWWSPASNAWSSSNLSEVTPDSEILAPGPLTAQAGNDGSIYIFGTDLNNSVATYAFGPSTFWRYFDLSETVVAR